VAVTFKEISTPGEPGLIEVRDGIAIVGHIRRHPSAGWYGYYPKGRDFQLNPTRRSTDLELLKRSILAFP
jgi:hypothetical protein